MPRVQLIQRTERCQSMVEMAFGMVVLLILLSGAVDLGRVFFAYMSLKDAAQEGAVYASMCPTDINKIYSRVRSSASHPVNMNDTANVQIACQFIKAGSEYNCSTFATTKPQAGDGVKVTVMFNEFPITMPFLGTILGRQSVTLTGIATDTLLRTTTCP